MLRICTGLLLLFLWGTDGTTERSTECKVSSYGTEFIFGFVDSPIYQINYFSGHRSEKQDPEISVLVTTATTADIYILLSSTGTTSEQELSDTTMYHVSKSKTVSLNSTLINKVNDNLSGGVVNITSDTPVAVTAVYIYYRKYTVSYPVLPSGALSTNYIIPSYKPNAPNISLAQFLVASLTNSTSVQLNGYETGAMLETLNQDEIFVYQRNLDLSSSSLTSNYPVAAFSSITVGERDSYLRRTLWKPLSMQVPPTDRHAVHFIIPPLSGVSNIHHNKIRIYTPVRKASVEIHSSSESTKRLYVYHTVYHEITTSSRTALEMVSDNPLVVVQIALNSNYEALFMMNVPAVSQFLNSYFTDLSSIYGHVTFLVTVPYEEAGGIFINQKPALHGLDEVAQNARLGNYSILTIRGTFQHVTVSHIDSRPFGLIAVGNDYGFPVGVKFTKPECTPDSTQTDPSSTFVG